MLLLKLLLYNLSGLSFRTGIMQANHQEEDRFDELLEKIRNLFKRENLCHNTYIFKKMHARLTIPLSLILEETSISRISKDEDEIIEALEYTKLAQVINEREVRIIQHPTVRVSLASHEGLREFQNILQQKDKKYEISKRFDTDDYINLTVFSENIVWLQKLINSIDKEIDFQKADLMEDIRYGVNRIRKLKVEHARYKTALGKTKYSMTSPPEIFIRKAFDSSSSDSQPDDEKPNVVILNGRPKDKGHCKQKNGKGSKKSKKPRIYEQDFPSLA